MLSAKEENIMSTKSWRQSVFLITMVGCIQFVLLTIIAMLFYPGGTHDDPTTPGYLFFRNFFSDLGLTVLPSGESNTISFLLFTLTLTLAGLAIILFFLSSPALFKHTPGRIPSLLGSFIGVFSGLFYIGIAFTPANLYSEWHGNFVLLAFSSFLLVVIFYTIAIFLNEDYPNHYAYAYLVFAVLLGAYLWLLFAGPNDLRVQATGQKAIVYAEIICMFIQSYGAWNIEKSRSTKIAT
jgi:hypothetical protein